MELSPMGFFIHFISNTNICPKTLPTAVLKSYPHIFRSRMHQGWFAFIAPSASSGTYFIERRILIRWWVGNEKQKRSIATD